MKRSTAFLAVLLVILFPAKLFSAKIVKNTITSQGIKRTYYLFVPDTVAAATPAPLILLLHGSGRNGLSLVEKWQDIAKKQGFILAGPDSLDSQAWRSPDDGPEFLHELIESLKSKYPIDERRVYLFGHSAGAVYALFISLMESEYFAGTAVHAGSLPSSANSLMEQAKRKIPIAIFVGTNDTFFPLPVVRATRDALNSRGYSVQLIEIKGHTHWYYDRAPEINRSAWEFLGKCRLEEAPRYQEYRLGK
jgi:poly(3-hydroxybutyrate) depolymerase